MIAIQEKIQTFNQDTEDVQKEIVRGSDEHLDILGEFTSSVNGLTNRLVSINEELVNAFNSMPKAEIQSCLVDMKDLYATLVKLKGVIRKSAFYKDAPNTYSSLASGTEELREMIYDLENFRLKEDDFDDFLGELNHL